MGGSLPLEPRGGSQGPAVGPRAPPAPTPAPRGGALAPPGGGVRPSCEGERARARALDAADPAARIFVPECEGGPGGAFRPAQCHNATGYCWCVDPRTGVPLPGPSTHNATPNCTLLDGATRALRG